MYEEYCCRRCAVHGCRYNQRKLNNVLGTLCVVHKQLLLTERSCGHPNDCTRCQTVPTQRGNDKRHCQFLPIFHPPNKFDRGTLRTRTPVSYALATSASNDMRNYVKHIKHYKRFNTHSMEAKKQNRVQGAR